MSEAGPIAIPYNLARLGQAGDTIDYVAGEEERAALARLTGVPEVIKFAAHIALSKLSPNRFDLSFQLTADVRQACVVTLEPVFSYIASDFRRELHFTPNLHRTLEKEVALNLDDDELPEEIASLHYDLAGPLIEEFVLGVDPYPRAPGVEFTPPEGGGDAPESPFAVLKSLKSGRKSTK